MRCDECGKDLGPRSKVYPLMMDGDLFSFCNKCVGKFDWYLKEYYGYEG